MLGKGAFGKVNLAEHLLTKKLVAIKSISKVHLNDEKRLQKVKQEMQILKKLRHVNVVQLYEYFETESHILFVTELAACDLITYVRKRRHLKEDIAKSIFK